MLAQKQFARRGKQSALQIELAGTQRLLLVRSPVLHPVRQRLPRAFCLTYVIGELLATLEPAIVSAARQLPVGFREGVAHAIFEGMRSQAKRLRGQPLTACG